MILFLSILGSVNLGGENAIPPSTITKKPVTLKVCKKKKKSSIECIYSSTPILTPSSLPSIRRYRQYIFPLKLKKKQLKSRVRFGKKSVRTVRS